MPFSGGGWSVCHGSSFFSLISPNKKLSLGSNCSLESAKADHGEEKMKGVVLGCIDTLVIMPQVIKSNACLSSLVPCD